MSIKYHQYHQGRPGRAAVLVFLFLWLSGTALNAQTASDSVFFGKTPEIRSFTGTDGHFSLEIKEESLASLPATVHFQRLKAWNFDPARPNDPVPAEVRSLDQQAFGIVGFMFPLEEGENIKAFLLTATTQTCCYGPRPEYNQYILVENSVPVPFMKARPVMVRGKFLIEPRPVDGYIFRMEGAGIELAPEQIMEDSTGSESIDLTKVPMFPWDTLESLQATDATVLSAEKIPFPPPLAELVGKPVIIEANIVDTAASDTVTTFRLGKYFWDGCCTGIFPNRFNSVTATLKAGANQPTPWLKSGKGLGILREVPPPDREKNGLLVVDEIRFVSLTDKKLNVDGVAAKFTPSIVTAAINNDIAMVKLLIRGGTSVEEREKEGKTALHVAAEFGFLGVAELLLKSGAKPDVLDQKHNTPLLYAAEGGSIAMAQLLASQGADLNVRNKFGFTPAAWAIPNNRTAMAYWLLKHGADIQAVNNDKRTLLHLAVMYGETDLVKFFIEKGVPGTTRDSQGRTPLMCAEERRDQKMIAVLKSLGLSE